MVEKFAAQHKVDFVFGTLFSHVVIGSAPRAGERLLGLTAERDLPRWTRPFEPGPPDPAATGGGQKASAGG